MTTVTITMMINDNITLVSPFNGDGIGDGD